MHINYTFRRNPFSLFVNHFKIKNVRNDEQNVREEKSEISLTFCSLIEQNALNSQ